MTDIEKKAREYAEQIGREYEYDGRETIAKQAFLAGAAYALSNQWHDAEKEKPEDEHTKVIVATNFNIVMTGYWSEQIDCWVLDTAYPRAYGKVVAWQPMPKYKPKGE